MEGPPYFRVVGVTGDIRSDGLDQPPVEAIYYPMVPAGDLTLWSPPRGMRLVVKTRAGAPPPLAGVRGILREIDPEVPIGRVQSMDAVVAASPSVARVSFTLMLLGAGAAMALLLSVVGLYGVISYTVGQRTSEMGIRLALGARGADVTRLVVWLGVVLSLAATRALRSQLFQVEPNDPVTLAAVSALLVAVALVASWLPARRAARVDPMSALRAE
jgi:ABC-type antimicrobial peptide transport system permease subunit